MSGERLFFYMHDLSGGGVERMRLALIAQLRSRGFDVTLVLCRRGGSLDNMLPADLSIVELGSRGMLQSVWPLARVLRRGRPDVLISSLDHNNITAMLAGLIARVPTRVVICQHNALSSERTMGWRYRVVPWLYWLLQAGAHGIVAVSDGVAADLSTVSRIARTRIETIYNPIVGANFPRLAGEAAPHIWLVDKSCPVYVSAGRLIAQKDPALLLDAMALVLARRPARLVILGEGALRVDLEKQAAESGISAHVFFAGFQANPLPWIRHADALVLASRYEGLGNVIVEALACGTPVIATNCPHGPSEILLDGEIGRLVPVGDAAALANAMLAQLDCQADVTKLKARAAAFTVEACADAHQRLFANMMPPERKVRALGMQLSSLRADQVVARIFDETATGRLRLIVTPNLDHLRLLRQAEFAAAYASADVVCPDGLPVLLYARLCGLRLSARVTGCELFHRLARHPRLSDQKLFIVVESTRSEEAVIAWAARLGLTSSFQVALAPRALAYDTAAQFSLASEIKTFGATVLVMTLGAPLSEVFVNRHRHILPPCWSICVGQAVRVELGLTERAPMTWRRVGLEWLWRVRQEPSRMMWRYVAAAAWFPIAVLKDFRPKPLL